MTEWIEEKKKSKFTKHWIQGLVEIKILFCQNLFLTWSLCELKEGTPGSKEDSI
jgi:hypothetical protein